jgi:hypothetical protein
LFVGLLLDFVLEFMTMLLNIFQTENNLAKQFQVFNIFNLGFQLVQDKLVKIMANTQAVLLMCFRMSKLID